MIPVTKPYLPNRRKLEKYLDGIYERNWLTNNGPLVEELSRRLEAYLGVDNLLLVANGTMALQVAYRALGIEKPLNGKAAEAVTTPFTFAATASSLEWEGVKPVFSDIDPDTWCLASDGIGAVITSETRAIVPVHVFGNACEIEKIQAIADQNNLKVIYDAAHAFGVDYKGESLLKAGDASTLSFHATKVFHTIEGGAIVFKKRDDLEKAKSLINFGITGPDEINELGINSKMSEFNAAMGLCVLDEMEENFSGRKRVWDIYREEMGNSLIFQRFNQCASNNYAYFPILLPSEKHVHRALESLRSEGVIARRYFYPSLDSVKVFNCGYVTEISRSISSRILCLPIYAHLATEDVKKIAQIIMGVVSE
ncbi:DegT/DnrJ/EryC1/StrS family aminotransferase [Marinobacter sp.]|uniref:DegT/DnrJ/EryC1/StrS family aminotransferase n=1 Tax=Marinobacter sp. TaxID=50741 RepID=UPI0035621500